MKVLKKTYAVKYVMCLAITVFTFGIKCKAQFYPQHYFIAPMDTPIYLSAPFGSLRDNHFHSGMDIRTHEKEGLPVYAVADGYVSRIKVSPFGYGKAVYITHPNGYTSVYGHLLCYQGKLADYIKNYQYQNETFDFDNFPGRHVLKVVKGQIIGLSGNSGGSTGPHLHFEIRDTKTEEPINPQLFNITCIDSLSPFIKRLVLYDVNGINAKISANVLINPNKLIKTDSGFFYGDILYSPLGKVGIAAEAYDYSITSKKEYSIYNSELYVDGRNYFSFKFDRINFDESKYINAHIDYETYQKEGYRIQKSFLDDGNRAKIYYSMRNKGYISIKDTSLRAIRYVISDASGHSYTLHFNIRGENIKVEHSDPCTNTILYPGINNTVKNDFTEIDFPAGAIYDTLNLCYTLSAEKYKNVLSRVVQVHNPYIPLHKNITVSLKSDSLNQNKLLLAYINPDGSLRSAGGGYKNGKVSASVSKFGNYAITIDSLPPEIRLLNTKDGVVNDTLALNIKITDNFSGVSAYRATLNGKWILMEYDAKSDLLTYLFDNETLFNTKQELVLTVTDKKGNIALLSKNIIFRK